MTKLTSAGVKLKATEIREQTGFSELEEGDELVGEKTAPGNLPAPAMALALARALVQRDGGARDTIRRETEALIRNQG